MQKYLFSFAFLQYALHEKIKLNQSKLFSAVEMDEERSCFVLKLLQMSWLLSQSSPAPCVCVAAPSNYGDRQVARSWRDTVHCGAAVRAAICLFKPPPHPPSALVLRNSLGAIWGLYSSAESFWLVLVRDFLFAQHEDIYCMLKNLILLCKSAP